MKIINIAAKKKKTICSFCECKGGGFMISVSKFEDGFWNNNCIEIPSNVEIEGSIKNFIDKHSGKK